MCRCSVNVMHWFTPAALFEPPKFCIVLAPTRKYFLVMVSYRHDTLNGSTIMWEFPIRSINDNIYWRALQSNISFILIDSQKLCIKIHQLSGLSKLLYFQRYDKHNRVQMTNFWLLNNLILLKMNMENT